MSLGCVDSPPTKCENPQTKSKTQEGRKHRNEAANGQMDRQKNAFEARDQQTHTHFSSSAMTTANGSPSTYCMLNALDHSDAFPSCMLHSGAPLPSRCQWGLIFPNRIDFVIRMPKPRDCARRVQCGGGEGGNAPCYTRAVRHVPRVVFILGGFICAVFSVVAPPQCVFQSRNASEDSR